MYQISVIVSRWYLIWRLLGSFVAGKGSILGAAISTSFFVAHAGFAYDYRVMAPSAGASQFQPLKVYIKGIWQYRAS